MKEIENTNVGSCLVHYVITPALKAEGDEDETAALEAVHDALVYGKAQYIGFTFPETPERLPVNDSPDSTNVFITVNKEGVTRFNNETDFTKGIISALGLGDGEITDGQYHNDSGTIKRIDITLSKVI